jgi:ribose transport system ATP-binding protein
VQETISNDVSVLAAERVSKSFGNVPVLFSVSFDIRAGEVHALIGENGAGKSTLMKILSGFHETTSGAIRLDGQEISHAARRPGRGSWESS